VASGEITEEEAKREVDIVAAINELIEFATTTDFSRGPDALEQAVRGLRPRDP
jgi:hypothetical protein